MESWSTLVKVQKSSSIIIWANRKIFNAFKKLCAYYCALQVSTQDLLKKWKY